MDADGIVAHIRGWMADYATKAGCAGFVVGVSGGIDSAVTSALAAGTGMDVLCLEMPIHQHPSQVSRASQHIDALVERYPNVRRHEVQLTEVFDTFVSALPSAEGEKRNLSLANARARLRMTTLYYFAGFHNLLVAGTGNKVEDFGVGFYTKYGDGGVDISPIADLTKTEVYALGEVLGVNSAIMQAPPTDGLWGDDRTDEDQIGASYPELEWAMAHVASGAGDDHLSAREATVLGIYRRLHRANRHKMDPIPVCEIPVHLKG
jgi:NAD+ synthase